MTRLTLATAGVPGVAPDNVRFRTPPGYPGLLLLTVLIVVGFLQIPASAYADVAAAETCAPDPATACVLVNVLDGNNTPVAGVGVTLTAPDGSSSAGVSIAEGPTVFQSTSAVAYSITLDPATLPPEFAGTVTEHQVTAQFGANARATFRLAEAAPAPTTSQSTTTSSPTSGGTAVSEPVASSSGITSDRVWQQLASGLRFSLMLALASLGANLIYGTTRLSNFAHGEQVTLGAVFSFLLVNSLGLPLWLSAIIAVVLCAATGWVQDALIWLPLRRRGTPVTQTMIVTIGLSIALQFLIQFLVGTGTFQVVGGNPSTWTIGPVTMPRISFLAMGISLVAIAGVWWFLTRTRLGQATRAVSDNPALASTTGINTNSVIRLVWTLACGLAGLSGILFALMFGAANWNMGMQMLLLMFAAITLGGLGTANGALVGSLIIGFAVELTSLFLPSDLRYATALFILIIALLVRPQGILGLRDRIG
ncbi:MAG: branched-chain amino acid ABC transporter permease [Ancrocorticia sp.]